MTMKILVTGAGGTLGGAIVAALKQDNPSHQLFHFSRRTYPQLDAQGVKQIQGDLFQKEKVMEAVRGMDAVFHAAAITDIWGRWDSFYQTNVMGTQHIVDACLKQGVPRLVYTSSPSAVFGKDELLGVDETVPYPQEHLSFYAKTKALAEQYVLSRNNGTTFLTTALRPHLIWGPGDTHLVPTLVEKARAGKLKRVGDGKNLVDVIYVENAARAHVLALKGLIPGSPVCGQSYFLGQENPVRLWDFVDAVLDVHGLPGVKKSISASKAYFAGYALEKTYATLGIYDRWPPMTRFVSLMMSKSHYFSHARARKDFGYHPEVGLEEGLAKYRNFL